MDELGGNVADGTTEMVSESAVTPAEELRKRRSTRIVQAVPLAVTGVDALGRPFTERTSSLIINCHGCRYQSKHYVLKNMWVSLEIPHPEAGQLPRTVRGKVAWIQRPRTVRQLFQIALELEYPGNVWGIAFPPEDWAAFAEARQPEAQLPPRAELSEAALAQMADAAASAGVPLPLTEADFPPAIGMGADSPDNLRIFPSPASATDASLQLARHVARLLSDAKQQLQTAVKECAAQAVGAERKAGIEELERQLAAAREALSGEVAGAIARLQTEWQSQSRTVHAAAAQAMENDLPGRLAPQLEQLTRDLTSKLSQEGAAQRNEYAEQLAQAAAQLQELCRKAEESAARLGKEGDRADAQLAARAESALRSVESVARQGEEAAATQRSAVEAAANEALQRIGSEAAAAHAALHSQVAADIEASRQTWQAQVDEASAGARERALGGLDGHVQNLLAQFQEETAKYIANLRETAARTVNEAEQRISALPDALEERTQRIENALGQAAAAAEQLENSSARIDTTQSQALSSFQSQLDDALGMHRNELRRLSESLFGELNGRMQASFEEISRQTLAGFEEQARQTVQPHLDSTQEALHRLAGGRSLLDAALALHQDRIRNAADEAFAESLARFRDNLGGVEQIVHESAEAITSRNLAEMEDRVADLKRHGAEELCKTAEWYEKKAQTQMQGLTEKFSEHAINQLREKAGEVSRIFASELDHSSRNFVAHTQTQMEEAVREAFDRSRGLFADAADTTTAAFTDDIQRNARQEIDGFSEELQRVSVTARTELENARAEHFQKLSAEQEDFLRRFHAGMSGAVEAGVAEAKTRVEAGFAPLLDTWKSMTDEHQEELRGAYAQISNEAAQQYRNRLENVSNSWMVAAAATLDHQSREVIAKIAAAAEEKLRETCAQVFAGIGDSLRERLQQISAGFGKPEPPAAR